MSHTFDTLPRERSMGVLRRRARVMRPGRPEPMPETLTAAQTPVDGDLVDIVERVFGLNIEPAVTSQGNRVFRLQWPARYTLEGVDHTTATVEEDAAMHFLMFHGVTMGDIVDPDQTVVNAIKLGARIAQNSVNLFAIVDLVKDQYSSGSTRKIAAARFLARQPEHVETLVAAEPEVTRTVRELAVVAEDITAETRCLRALSILNIGIHQVSSDRFTATFGNTHYAEATPGRTAMAVCIGEGVTNARGEPLPDWYGAAVRNGAISVHRMSDGTWLCVSRLGRWQGETRHAACQAYCEGTHLIVSIPTALVGIMNTPLPAGTRVHPSIAFEDATDIPPKFCINCRWYEKNECKWPRELLPVAYRGLELPQRPVQDDDGSDCLEFEPVRTDRSA